MECLFLMFLPRFNSGLFWEDISLSRQSSPGEIKSCLHVSVGVCQKNTSRGLLRMKAYQNVWWWDVFGKEPRSMGLGDITVSCIFCHPQKGNRNKRKQPSVPSQSRTSVPPLQPTLKA